MKLPVTQIAGFIGAEDTLGPSAMATGYSIDSRTIASGQLFFAVRGERLDGHDFVPQALQRGAVGAVVREDQLRRFADRSRLLPVADPLTALQALATSVRDLWGRPLVAVTGSAGKTTTKEMIARLLATRFGVLKTEGNFNNHFGLPLQLLRLEPEHDLAVVELGMSRRGEIAALAKLAGPNVGVVTNVAPVHLSFFQSVAEIARAKRELIEALPPSAIAVLNADDEYVSQFGRDFCGRVVTYGLRNPADLRAERLEILGMQGVRFKIVVEHEQYEATLPLLGIHNVYNALAAVAVAVNFGIPLEAITAELARFSAVDKRGQILQIAGATVVNDCYNSNPRALESMIDALAGMTPGAGGRRILVAGEMLELGPTGEDLHRRCGQHAAKRGIDVLIGVRGLAKAIVEGSRQPREGGKGSRGVQAEFLESPQLAGEWLAREVRPGDVVLMKASRGVQLERALEVWRSKLSPVPAAKGDD